MENKKNDLFLSNNARFIIRNNQVVATNQLHGEWIRFSKECYDYLMQAIKLGLSRHEFLEAFVEKEDQEYIKRLLDHLEQIKVIVNSTEKNREKEPNLETVQLMLTNRCNLQCKHCSTNAANENKGDFFDFNDIKSIIDKLVSCNVKAIILTGGEPLLRKDFMEIVHYIKSQNEKIKITVMTNATLLSEEFVIDFVKYVNAVDISLDGYDEESCSRIRGKNVYAKVIQSIELLQKYGLNAISLSMISLGKNQEAEKKFYDLCKKLKVKPMIRRLTFMGRAKENREYLESIEDERRVSSEVDFSVEKYRKCLKACSCRAGIEVISINERGQIFPCSTFDCDMEDIGNVMEIDSLYDLLKKQGYYSENEKKFYKYSPYYGEICKECSVRFFCLPCPYATMDMLKDNARFVSYCQEQKDFLYRVVWGEGENTGEKACYD